jgi:drug/metabolite transporter superfamily protein YnfA
MMPCGPAAMDTANRYKLLGCWAAGLTGCWAAWAWAASAHTGMLTLLGMLVLALSPALLMHLVLEF